MTEAATGAATDTTRRSRLEHLPALDGLRGACLAAVLLFHSGFGWMSGGFLGVSTFFTLSGFLITTLLVAERSATGTVSLRRFWERRLRRLLPASLLTIAAIVATAPLWLAPSQREHLAEDALATLFYAVNWRFMSPEYAYNLIFTDPSPLQHFWSLAIEGQFYVVFPLLVALVLRAGGGTHALGAVCIVATVASVGVALASPSLEAAQHRLYYGTDARAGELLIGALLALALRARGAAAWSALRVAGPVAGLLIVAAWVLATVGDAWLYRGGFALYALCSATVVAAAARNDGAVYRVLSVGWLRWVGTVSYGAYLFHWPVFLILTPARTGLPALPLLVVRTAATLGLAALSYRFVERPLRRTDLVPTRRFARGSAAAFAAVALLIVASNPVLIAVRAYAAAVSARNAVLGAPVPSGWTFAMYGDSTALSLWNGLGPWLQSEGGSRAVNGALKLGCGVLAFGQMENRGAWIDDNPDCRDIPAKWTKSALDAKADVAIVLVGPWEARTRRRTATSPALRVGDRELDDATRDAIAAAVDALASTGTSVVWLTAPHIQVPPLQGKSWPSDRDTSEPQRMERVNQLAREVAATRPDRMRVVDLAAYMAARPSGEFDTAIRADDVHYTRAGAAEVAREFVGPEVLRAARELRAGRPPVAAASAR